MLKVKPLKRPQIFNLDLNLKINLNNLLRLKLEQPSKIYLGLNLQTNLENFLKFKPLDILFDFSYSAPCKQNVIFVLV